tara:strand:- start:695 stop:1252 length:558 start_codon:yes stop_codon:yes gene_type:complete
MLSGLLFSQSEAYDALRDLSPYIGKWESKQSSYGLFEGLPDNTDIIYNVEYEWITDESAILETWESTSLDGKERINVGSILYTLDPATNSIKTKHFGYDGKVYWSGNGWLEKETWIHMTPGGPTPWKTFRHHIEELTINGTHTRYTNEFQMSTDVDDQFESQFVNIVQNGKVITDQTKRTMKRVD